LQTTARRLVAFKVSTPYCATPQDEGSNDPYNGCMNHCYRSL